MAGLTYPTKLTKLGLRREELREVSEEKVKVILLKAEKKELKDVKGSLEEVLKKILRQDNITDSSKSDGRCKDPNEFYQVTGALSNQTDSPSKEKSRNPTFVAEKSEAYHSQQTELFELLNEVCKLPGDLTWRDGLLYRNNTPLTAVELCNTIDEVTLAFLDEEGPKKDSITVKTRRGEEMNKMIECLEKIVANRGVTTSVFADDILSDAGHKKWKNHLNIHASFTALWVAMEEVKRK